MTESKLVAGALREQIRTFHLTGAGLEDALPFEGLSPVGLEEFDAGLAEARSAWPMFAAPGEAARPFLEVLRGIFATHEPTFPAAGAMAEEIAAAFGAAAAEVGVAPVPGVVERALALFTARTEQLERDFKRLPAALPDTGLLIPFSAKALPWIHAAAMAQANGGIRREYCESLKQCRDRLRELLALDESNSVAARSPEYLAASLGGGAGLYFNAAVLSAALRRPKQASKPMDAARRMRCQQAIAILDDAWRQTHEEPAFWIFAQAGASENPFSGRAVYTDDPCHAALQFAVDQLTRAVPVFKALRIAKLELAGAYDAVIHDPLLDRFQWETADDTELKALPRVTVQATTELLSGAGMASFVRLLGSGVPLQVLTTRGPLDAGDVKTAGVDIGNLAMAVREAFVLQSALADSDQLLAGLEEMARSLRPAVAVVAAADSLEGFESCALLPATRSFPLFRYDPERSDLWSGRIVLRPVKSGAAAAHAAARSVSLRHCFRLIPESASEAEQMELGEYVKAYARRPPLAIPYLSVRDEKGELRRAILTRGLVDLCREKARSWALLEQLAKPAEKPAPVVSVDPGMREAARREGAAQAIQKVVSILMEAT